MTAAPGYIDGCFSTFGCSGDTIGLRATGSADVESRECCVNTPAMSYNLNGQCFDCTGILLYHDSAETKQFNYLQFLYTVYGFLEDHRAEPESLVPYSIEIGFLKRPDSVTNVLAGTIRHQPGSACELI